MYDKEILESHLAVIAQLTSYKYKDYDDNLGVLAGISGVALFQFYYSKHTNNDYHADIGAEIITHCIEKINTGFSHPSFCNGIAGLAWVIQHLRKEGFIELNSDDLLSQFDDFLYKKMIIDFRENKYDFLHGALGYAFYFFKRFKETERVELREKYQNILFFSISEMERLSTKDNNSVKWLSIIDPERNISGYNLGAAHGMANVLNFFSRLHHFEIFRKSTKTILELGVKYMLTVQNKTAIGTSLFPNAIIDGNSIQYKSRLAWCHGDLGIGISMIHVAEALNSSSLMKNALCILKHSAKRKKSEDTMVVDAGFCHGSYGNAHIYQAVNQRNPNKMFHESSKFWIQDGLKKAKFQDGYAGYKQMSERRSWYAASAVGEGGDCGVWSA